MSGNESFYVAVLRECQLRREALAEFERREHAAAKRFRSVLGTVAGVLLCVCLALGAAIVRQLAQ